MQLITAYDVQLEVLIGKGSTAVSFDANRPR